MSAILKFNFQKRKQLRFFWSKLSKLHKKRPNFTSDNYIFPKTRGNKNKQWTHSTPVKIAAMEVTPSYNRWRNLSVLPKAVCPQCGYLASTTGFILAPTRRTVTACKRQRGSCFWLATDVPVWHEKVSYGTLTCNEPIMYPKILKHGLPALRLECMVLSRFVMYYRVFIRRLYATGCVSFRPKFWSTGS